jgi:hypothetical protein
MLSAIIAWFPNIPAGAFGIILAVLGALVAVLEFKGAKRFWWASAFILLGVFELVVIIRADQAHDAEVTTFTHEINGVKEQLHQSELARVADTNKLQGKVEVFAEFAPAVIKLAQATELSARKTFEAKMLSNKDLYDATIDVVKKLREFGQRRRLESSQQTDANMAAMQATTTEAEKAKVWADQSNKLVATYYQKDAEFRTSILPDAVYVRNELLRRKIPEPPPNPMRPTSMVQMVFTGSLAGAYPEFDAADYLEQMAKQLRLK